MFGVQMENIYYIYQNSSCIYYLAPCWSFLLYTFIIGDGDFNLQVFDPLTLWPLSCLSLHLQNIFLLSSPLSRLTVMFKTLSLPLSFVETSRPGVLPPVYSSFLSSCPHFLPLLVRLPWGSWLGSLLTLFLSDSGVLLIRHGCGTQVAKTSWRKHTIGPADIIFKSGLQISNELYPPVIPTAFPSRVILSYQVT